MKSKTGRKLLLAAALASVLAVPGSKALAQNGNMATVEGYYTGTSFTATVTSDPIVTAILSQPGTFNSKTYSSWAVLATDGTGSMELFGTMPNGYTPAVGDMLTGISGTYDPYHQIPEFEDLTSLSLVSQGNSVPAIGTSTIPTLNQATLPENVAGYLWTLDNVTISGISGTFGTANLTGTITDPGNNSMTLYYWPTSYSVANVNLDGMAIPTGPVDMTGFVSVYNNTSPEFTPLSITPVPEPGTLAAFGLGGLLLALGMRRRSSV